MSCSIGVSRVGGVVDDSPTSNYEPIASSCTQDHIIGVQKMTPLYFFGFSRDVGGDTALFTRVPVGVMYDRWQEVGRCGEISGELAVSSSSTSSSYSELRSYSPANV